MTAHPNSNPSEEPLYNIGVVSRMTDIPVATLRVWERRYGFPKSARTRGGHRLYSEKEILRLQWVKARIEEGMQTGRAIRALQHLERENRLPEAPLATTGAARPSPPGGLELPTAEAEASLAAFHARLTRALLAHDLDQAEQALGEALALYPLESLILEVIQPALEDIGRAWEEGRIGVATEHLVTNFLRHRLLMWMVTGPPAQRVPPVVLACAPGEWHEGSLLMLGVLLRRQGWPVTYLGQSVPLPDLADFVESAHPRAVVLIAMTEETARALVDWPRWMPEALEKGSPAICYGGRIFSKDPSWQKRLPGVFLGETLQQGLATLVQILRRPAL